MKVIVDIHDELDGDLRLYESLNGEPDEVVNSMSAQFLPDRLIDLVDEAISDLWGETPGAEQTVNFAKYEATVRKA